MELSLRHRLAAHETLLGPVVTLPDVSVAEKRAAQEAGIASGIAGPDDPALLAELAGGRSTVLVFAADVCIYARALEAGAEQLRRELALRAPEQEESHVRT
jgi:hypothetical protein